MTNVDAIRRLFLIAALTTAGCGGDLLGNEGFEIDCDGDPCDWKVVEGEPAREASWHEGDAGFDLSGSGRVVIEQRTAPFLLDARELLLGAAMVRRGGAALRVELDWYVAGAGDGPTYWDREPILVDSRGFAVDRRGVFLLEELISSPSLEVSGLALRLVKEGQGTAMVDEVSLSQEVLP
jgi:hypothetical protein